MITKIHVLLNCCNDDFREHFDLSKKIQVITREWFLVIYRNKSFTCSGVALEVIFLSLHLFFYVFTISTLTCDFVLPKTNFGLVAMHCI